MAELMCKGDIGKVALVTGDKSALKSHHKFDAHEKLSMATNEIQEILAPLERGEKSCFILIEGVPGIFC